MLEQPEPATSPVTLFARLVHLLGDPESDLADILNLFGQRPDWARELRREASAARGRPVPSTSDALLLLGFSRTRRLLTEWGPRAAPAPAEGAEASSP